MSPRTSQQFEEIRREKRNYIMEVALELFAKEGFHTTAISKIAKEAKIAKGLLYNYFENKDDLLHQIVKDGMMQMLQYFDPNHDGFLTDEEFAYYIRQVFKIFKENHSFWRLYYALLLQPNVFSIVSHDIIEGNHEYSKIFLDYFSRKGFENPEMELIIFSSTIKGAGISYVAAPDQFCIDEFVEEIIKRYS